ncbi:tetratricopeptide repeat protein [Bacteroidales bacterium OttesenSCG-928-B11]|nr:tetratricopeptide repeat protein [Bacteroidales bacterium OttesenSCG-928-E04]MDL2307991.1 tetratricopeptide repeat protein [Bacteroidales bacterium OttesenSCG-928-C03]MDL2311821.1 tetratricopeptide repeat protein [Bacteroidales bacterium OttesenSCG-928-B11]MDL2325530.1 tetratricopeptide repeat protein [Bacteroidales bacterium OttesenSCG-928-A14]
MKKLLFICLLFFSLGGFPAMAQQTTDEKLGIQYYQNGEFDKAVEIFSKSFYRKPNSYIYYYYYMSLLNLEDYKELEKMCKRMIKEQPNVQRFKIDLGYVYDRSGDTQKALKEYEAAIRNVKTTEAGVKELYNAFLSKALQDYAAQTLLRGRVLLKNNKLFTTELTNIYTRFNQTDKVIGEALNLVSDNNEIAYLTQAESILQNLLLDDENDQNYLTLVSTLQRTIQKEPANDSYMALLFWAYKLHKDYPAAFIIAKSIDRKAGGTGEVVFGLALEAGNNRDFTTAIEALDFVIAKGSSNDYYSSARYQLLDIKYQQLTSTSPVKIADALLLEKEFKKLLDEDGLHSGTTEWIRKYAHLLAFYVGKPDEAVEILNSVIATANRDPKEKATYKLDLADILLYSGSVWDATLLYSQVDKDLKNDEIGEMAKFKNAKLSFYIGEFKWAKSQLDVLRAATTKLIANDAMYFSLLISDNEEEEDEEGQALFFDENAESNKPLRYFAKADFLRFQNRDDAALTMFDSVLIIQPFGTLTDDVYYQKAEIAIRQGKYLEAEQYLKKIIETYSDDILGDDAMFLLAELYEYYLKDIPGASSYYQKLLKDYPGSLYVIEARKRFRALRGDNI